MSFRLKILLLVSTSVVTSLTLVVFFSNRLFTAEIRSLVLDLQSEIAVQNEHELTRYLDILYSQLEGIETEKEISLEFGSSSPIKPQALVIWKNGQLQGATDGAPNVPPVTGKSKWTIESAQSVGYLSRWIARYSEKTLILYFSKGAFSELLRGSHGASVQLVAPDGLVIGSGTENPAGFDAGSLINRLIQFGDLFSSPSGVAHSHEVLLPGRGKFLGTFVRLPVDPPVLLTVAMDSREVDRAGNRLRERIFYIGLGLISFFLFVGIWLVKTMTDPLHGLAKKITEIGSGDINDKRIPGEERHDEIGLLSRSLSQMKRDMVRFESELKRKERLASIGEFSAKVAHEVRNPISGILANAEVLEHVLGQKSDAESVRTSLSFIKSEAERAGNILNRLLRFSRQDTYAFQRIDLVNVTEKFVTTSTGLFEKNQIRLKFEKSIESIWVLGDEERLHEVFQNLIRNAVEATESKSERHISVRVWEDSGFANWEIIDNGSGISEEMRNHLFEPFFTTKTVGKGTGLGLSTCHGIVDSHHGKIWAESNTDEGTSFRVQIPVVTAQKKAA